MSSDEVNPWLQGQPDNKGGADTVEDPTRPRNIVWQSRARPPSEYENELADALERIFADGVHDLADIVERLNQDFPKTDGSSWTEDGFQAEMKQLGGAAGTGGQNE